MSSPSPPAKTGVKICGVTTPDILDICVAAKADFVGFVFYPKSVRNLPLERASPLISRLPPHVKSVGLFVNPSDDEIDAVVSRTKLDYLQLHGDETPERLAAIKSRFQLPVMKAICVAAPEDLVNVGPYQSVADWILFDAKIENAAGVPGGHGAVFDWKLLKNIRIAKPWMLSGGLTAANIGEALKTVHPNAVDVSSGVEATRGVKSPDKIREFIGVVNGAVKA